jgi:response regulator RpfG family c-di-GMP phosphodiesterase
MMGRLLHRLSTRIIGLIVLATISGAWLVSISSEQILEDALLTAAKRQALVFLAGMEEEILRLPDPSDPLALQTLVEGKGRHRLELLDFAVLDLYLFSADGTVLAHLRPRASRKKHLEGYLVEALTTGHPYLADEIEYYVDPEDGVRRPKADIVLPVDLPVLGRVGLEVEMGLTQTMAMIGERDNIQERQALLVIMVVTTVMALFIGWVVHRGLIRPVGALEEVTRRITAGDLDARVEGVSGRDELGRLGQAVNGMADSIQQLLREQEDAYLQMLQSLAKALETKDAYTASHSSRVSRYAVRLARRLGFSDDQLKVLKQGALMHDLGKIGIADAVLNKPSALTDAEYEQIQRHPVYTAAIMRPLKRLAEHAAIAAWHHERWDGRGYPDGLKGEEIPLAARIVAIADTWDAMTGDRVYRRGMPVEKALAILTNEVESGQFEPQLLETFLEMIREDLQRKRTTRPGGNYGPADPTPGPAADTSPTDLDLSPKK